MLPLRKKHESKIHTKSEGVQIWYEDPLTGNKLTFQLEDTGVPIVPHSWYHVCMGIDTVSGLLRVVANGIEVANVEKEYGAIHK